MRRAKVEAGFAIFLLFFGTAMIDAVRQRSWAMCLIYLVLALLFLVSGSRSESITPTTRLTNRRLTR